MSKIIVVSILVVVLGLSIFAIVKYPEEDAVVIEELQPTQSIDVEAEVNKRIGERIEVLENDVLAQLANCETGSVQEQDAALILDTNGKMSIGRFQFQRKTVQFYYKELYDKDITRVEAIQIAIDQEKSTELTRDILFGVEEGWSNWLNCAKRNNLPSQINLIKKVKQ